MRSSLARYSRHGSIHKQQSVKILDCIQLNRRRLRWIWQFSDIENTLTCPGTNLPLMTIPSGGVTLGSPIWTGLCTRKPSSMQACRYGSSVQRCNVISSRVWNALRISVVRVESTFGLTCRYQIKPVMAVAVVSKPASTELTVSAWLNGHPYPSSHTEEHRVAVHLGSC